MHLTSASIILVRTENIERTIIGERIRVIELLGLFTAILAFIFSSIQIISKSEFPLAFVLIIGIGLVLLTFLLTLHLFLDPYAKNKTAIIILIVLCLLLFALPWYGKLVMTIGPGQQNISNSTQNAE